MCVLKLLVDQNNHMIQNSARIRFNSFDNTRLLPEIDVCSHRIAWFRTNLHPDNFKQRVRNSIPAEIRNQPKASFQPLPQSSYHVDSHQPVLSGVHRHSDKHATGKIPKAQCAFKILMIHEVLQFALRIAFRCVLHLCGNLDIHR